MPPELFEQPKTAEEQIVVNQGESMEVDHIEYGSGIQVYVKGYTFPQKGLPTIQAIQAINLVKKLIVEGLKLLPLPFLILISKKRMVNSFSAIGYGIVAPHILKYHYLTPTAQATLNFVMSLCVDFDVPFKEAQKASQMVAAIIEYDSAYRFRLMDILSESSKEKLVTNPRKELLRLLDINKQRDYEELSTKIGRMGRLISWALVIPTFKKAFIKAVKASEFYKFKYDEADIYWAYHKRDYNYLGKTYEQRQKLLLLWA